MNKTKLFVSALFLLAVFSFLTSTEKVFATVGGPTYISGIASDATNKFLYYTVNDGGGRGCPPIVHKVDLNTLQDAPVKSCDDFEKEFPYTEAGLQAYNQFISSVYENFLYLGSVSLEKNNITVDVKFISEEIQEGYGDSPVWSNFRARISQDGRELGSIDFRGCTADQPHIFEGYMIPNSDTMALLISNKGDCFEGGYVKETLHVISGVKYYDTNIVRSFKTASATEPNVGNVVARVSTEQSSAVCSVNGKTVDCPESLSVFAALFFLGVLLIVLVVVILMVVSLWKIHLKANQPGWAVLVPYYNIVVLLHIVRRPGWWVLPIVFVPVVNIVLYIIVLRELARVFGKGVGFTLGLLFLPFIFYPILGFGSATYQPAQTENLNVIK